MAKIFLPRSLLRYCVMHTVYLAAHVAVVCMIMTNDPQITNHPYQDVYSVSLYANCPQCME